MDRTRPTGKRRIVERREFLASGIALAAGASAVASVPGARAVRSTPEDRAKPAAPAAAQAAAPVARSPDGIQLRRFGNTGLTLPVLGMGGSAMVVKFVLGYGTKLLPFAERVAMVRKAYDSGVRYFDTARIYGESEAIFGQALGDVRDKVFLATKCHATESAAVRKSVEKSLEELKTDRVDLLQLHSPAIEALGFEKSMEIHAEMMKLRDQGLCKFLGLTTHVAFETVYRMIATGGFDQVLLALGYFRKGMDTMLSNRNLEFREMCVSKAHELGMAVVAMKVLGANILSHNSPRLVPDFEEAKRKKLAAAAIRWVLRDERISMLNIGVSMPSDIDQNVATLRGDLTFTSEDALILAEYAGKAYESDYVKGMKVT